MKNLKYYLLAIFYTCVNIWSESQGQNLNISPQVVQSVQATSGEEKVPTLLSPDVYLLSKYGNIPVNYSTGVPNISIPLMTLEDRGLKLDVSLSYHASGIKVDEESPWTGLGWSLNAGGIISRIVRGVIDLPNQSNTGLIRSRTSIADYQVGQNFLTYRDQAMADLYNAESTLTDNNPDIFTFNFAGYSGKFFLDDNLNPIFFEHQDFKVKYLGNSDVPYFIITTDDGVIYEFGQSETIYDRSTSRLSTTAWHLTKMTSPTGGEINFVYKPGGAPSPHFQEREYDVFFTSIEDNATSHGISGSIEGMRPYGKSTVYSYILKEIYTSSGNKIELNQTSSSRLDAEGGTGNMLNEIVLKDGSGNQQKKFTLHYNYFEADNNHKTKPIWGNAVTFLNYRLRLDSLREVSNLDLDNNICLTHRFDYYYNPDPEEDSPYTLPYRLSPCQDHWGYYNHSYNQTIFPSNPSNKQFHIDEWYKRFLPGEESPTVSSFLISGGGNREPDNEAVKAGSLKKITYPTGGYVIFDYEPNSYIPDPLTGVGGIRIKEIINSNGETKHYNYSANAFEADAYPLIRENQYYTLYHQNDVEIGNGRPELMETFGIPPNVYYKKPFILRMDSYPQAAVGSGPAMVYDKVEEIISGNGKTVYEFSYFDDWDSNWAHNMDGVTLAANFHSAHLTSIPAPGYPQGIYIPKVIDSSTWPYPEKINTDWKRGHLITKTIYNESGQKLQVDSVEYDLSALRALPGYKVIKMASGYEYVYARNYTVGGQVKVKREFSKQYMADGSEINIVTEYDYNESPHKKVKEQRAWNSDGSKLTTKYYYPTEYSSGLFSSLINKNMLYPIDTRTYKGNRLISGNQVQFDEKGNPLVAYRAEVASGVNDIAFNSANPYTFAVYATSSYFPSGLFKSFKSTSEIPTTYLWGYNRQYPIAKIEGADYAAVESAISGGENTISALESSITPNMSAIDVLRASLPKALITTYTYKPLVGISTITDPRGVVTRYEYDGFGRLKWIKDMNGNIVQSYEYNYKNQ